MRTLEVRIDDGVFLDLTEFYKFSLRKHSALDEITVLKKEQRLIQSLKDLGKYALTDNTPVRHIPWIRKGYKDYYQKQQNNNNQFNVIKQQQIENQINIKNINDKINLFSNEKCPTCGTLFNSNQFDDLRQ